MKQIVVGIYSLGYEAIELVIREGNGGEFYNRPGKGQVPRIKIGADVDAWKDVVSVFLHECFEFIFNRLQCRYEKSYDMGADASGYLYVATHPQFSDVCARVGEGVATALPDLSKAWKKWGTGGARKKS